ncbi:hypothetical protein PLG01_01958 [Streptococcus mutans PKUSS-LG01]|nr:hypothetical protein PLG01_01958 [Streptococcus mutans PKUSS-LG01]
MRVFILSSERKRLKKRVLFKLNFFFNPNADSSGLFHV